MLVMCKMDIDLRNYLKQNHDRLNWKERTNIIYYIIESIHRIHGENAVHRDLHSGNVLYSRYSNEWYISDLGFCGPADKPLGSIQYMEIFLILHLRLFLEKNIHLHLIFIVLECLCGKFHLGSHHL